MEDDKTVTEHDEAHLAEIAYHRKQNRLVMLWSLPSTFLYGCFYYYLSNYFQVGIFILMMANSVSGLIIGSRLKDIKTLTLYKRISAGIWFALFATNLLTGLWDKSIYYIVLPWIFLYPIAAIMFIGRRLGFIVGTLFSVVALIFFLMNDVPPLDARNLKMFQFNAVFALLTILMVSIIYEKIRMKVQDDLALSENQYRLAEMRQRETNVELEKEIERRKQSESALAQSELHYRALFEESVTSLWEEDWSELKIQLDLLPEQARSNLAVYFMQTPEVIEKYLPLMKLKAVNRATLKLYGAESFAMLLNNLHRLVSPQWKDFLIHRTVSLYLTGRYDTELVGKTLPGETRHLLISSAIPAGYEASWEKVFSSVYDVTERMEMEREKKRVDQQMQNARKIEAIATLAGGIAHQFNNALAVIFGSLDLLEVNLQGNAENRRFLASLKTSAGRMTRLTDQLLAYAEGGKYQPQDFSINDLLNDVISSKSIPRASKIQILTDLDQDILLTTGDILQIKMVVEVVLSNAFEAMQPDGVVRIATGRTMMEGPPIKTDQPIKPGEYTFICIEDNGVGMKEETLNRIFEPFFTTKIHGRGLGMAAAFGIVRNHDGLITVDSELGHGTKVVIYLPSANNQAGA